MNFFERQEAARRTSRRLLWLLVPAMLGIVLAANCAALFAWWVVKLFLHDLSAWPGALFFLAVSLATLWVIGLGTWDSIRAVAEGGAALAEALGARPLEPRTGDLAEQRLRNVVEEMAIAAGMAVPRVYVMDGEQSVNALAAGFSTADAVLIVTRGLLDELRRDELQGVIAHEFSHILNGDIRINMRLIGLLGGILKLWHAGQALLDREDQSVQRQRDRGLKPKGNLAYVLGGALLQAVGSLGSFMARLIRAGVSRQRELLADSCAVQFTRDTDGIAGALVKLERHAERGRIHHWRAEQASHMFFGDALEGGRAGRFATHPTVAQRLANIYGRRVTLDEVVKRVSSRPAAAAAEPAAPPAGVADSIGTISRPQVAYASAFLESLPAPLREALHAPEGAAVAMCALVLAPAGEARDAQVAMLGARADAVVAVHQSIAALGRTARLPLVELAIPALRALAGDERRNFLARLHAMIAADRRMTLEEFVLEVILASALQEPGRAGGEPELGSLDALVDDTRLMLSLVAHAGGANPAQAFAAGCKELGSAMQPIPVKALTLEGIQGALARLRRLRPLQKPRLLKALACASLADAKLAPAEAELLRAVSAALDCPMPPVAAA
ncbi:MAG TPA: M48 family metalloprotease [Burkholderiales bacterium]|nr:M48 family metalloprotease [Burkholderiales bacterium]